MNAFTDAGTFLIQSLAYIYLIIILLRFLLQLSRADFYNPVSQFAHKATRIFLVPLRKVFPSWRNVDLACIVLGLLLQWLAIQVTVSLHGYGLQNPLTLLMWGAIGILSLTVNFYIYGLLAAIILSWVAPHNPHPAISLLWQLMEPVMAPFRRLIPPLGGIDLSPIFMFMVLKMFGIFIVHAAGATGLPIGAVPGI